MRDCYSEQGLIPSLDMLIQGGKKVQRKTSVAVLDKIKIQEVVNLKPCQKDQKLPEFDCFLDTVQVRAAATENFNDNCSSDKASQRAEYDYIKSCLKVKQPVDEKAESADAVYNVCVQLKIDICKEKDSTPVFPE